MTSAPEPDPLGAGYLIPYFHGTLGWPVTGVRVDGGGYVSPHWRIGGEFSWRGAATGRITEESGGHSERSAGSARFRSRESLASVLVGLRPRPRAATNLEAVGGVTFSFSEQSLTDRHGLSSYPGFPPIPFTRPDAMERRTRWGLAGGADATFRVRSHVAIVATARVHWIRRQNPDVYSRLVPGLGRFVVQVGGGLRWQSAK